MYALKTEKLCKSYKGVQAVKNVDIVVDEGCVTGFIGQNGAGKTTTIKMILGLVAPDSGSIKIFGKTLADDERGIKDKLGVVLDQGYLYDDLTVSEMQKVVAPAYSRWDVAAFSAYTAKFALDGGKRIKELSKGMKMKLALALALSHNADMLIMDEPTSGLDPVIRKELLEIIRVYMENENKSVFFSTHITTDLDKIADRIVLIDNGSIIFQEDKDVLLDSHRLVQGSKAELSERARGMFVMVEERGFGFEGLTNKPEELKQLLTKAEYAKPTVEDIMLAYTLGGTQK